MGGNASGAGDTYKEQSKKEAVRLSNIVAARAVADCVRTSLGPRGMDKLIQSGNGDVVITNDGATILKSIEVLHPAGRMLGDLSASQDIEAGDGTTSVVVTAGALLGAAQKLLARGINPTAISEAFGKAVVKAEEILTGMAIPLDLADRESLIQAATTSLSSKVRRAPRRAPFFPAPRRFYFFCTSHIPRRPARHAPRRAARAHAPTADGPRGPPWL